MPATDDVTQPRRPEQSNPEAGLERRHGAGLDRSPATMATVVRRASSTPSPLPSPFDDPRPSLFQSVDSDDKCPKFMTTLLSDPTFKSCYPLSMLLQTSNGFFDAQKQLPSIVGVLDAACKANAASCTEFLNRAADNLAAVANCKAELDQGQSRVLQAWRGLRAYRTLYTASCLQDPSSGMYCFANAVSNLNNPSDSYLYFMPYGLALPGASTPSCNKCTSETMRVYHAASANRSDFVSDKYEAAANQINVLCGPSFVNATLPRAEAAASLVPPPLSLALLTSILAILVTLGSLL
ncbi:C6 transcription factor [Hirsutella rhossiliensis]|uniref:C6 transcription factor n=1 Tax=Hirsutella rhossiliensis TaxID=111463 RepID=A0A9P8SHD9_9HYPO|nr:C6 transcription factor [Hirsutella rhossiliensis]KAH0963003.1 C6 transcription factor [Hirsutella rhossiliensis]